MLVRLPNFQIAARYSAIQNVSACAHCTKTIVPHTFQSDARARFHRTEVRSLSPFEAIKRLECIASVFIIVGNHMTQEELLK
eukprot:scaffold233008_cov39-Prasinocladus_malaysianus.AAC.1